MSRFIRKVKTASGATAVQIVHKRGRAVSSIDHIGSAHNATELKFLVALARKHLYANQLSINLFPEETPGIFMVDGQAEFKRNRFLKVTGSKREINQELVAEARRKAGIKGYVTEIPSRI